MLKGAPSAAERRLRGRSGFADRPRGRGAVLGELHSPRREDDGWRWAPRAAPKDRPPVAVVSSAVCSVRGVPVSECRARVRLLGGSRQLKALLRETEALKLKR